ncbi:MAG: class I mannose-6-phosphate isomerase [Clostridia bacterium]|nr:class I mannose-6-phosphate isomerase [Clostridia bacterium]
MYALKLIPATKDFIWGGDSLKTKWNKKTDKDIIAESWELSCHKEGPSIIANGEYKGMSLSDLLDKMPDLKGKKALNFKFFPILIKLIDAKTNLSIQVHPSDEYALANEGQFGKTEMWYIVDVKEGGGVYCGFKEKYSIDEVAQAIKENRIMDILNFVEVKKGDCIYIPSGTVHAICGGLLICEVQQNSSLTYRLYDYDRVDAKGNKRELHIEKSLKVIDPQRVGIVNEEVKQLDANKKLLASCKYFTTTEIKVDGTLDVEVNGDSFASITVVDGCGEVIVDGNKETLALGDTCFIPANYNYTLKGKMTIIEARV